MNTQSDERRSPSTRTSHRNGRRWIATFAVLPPVSRKRPRSEVHAFIRREIARSHGDAVAGAIRILCGGSVKADNAAALLAQADVDGALVGGACLEADSFLKIVRAGA